jgi:hypothetical protein
MTTMDDMPMEPVVDFISEPSGSGDVSPENVDFIGDGATAGLSAVGVESTGTIGSFGADLSGDNIDVSDIAQGFDDLASGNLDGAAGYGVTVGLDAALAAGGIGSGVDGVAQLVEDFLNDDVDKLGGDAEAIGIQTTASIALDAIGDAVAGPLGGAIGGALGEFVGDALTPAVEDVASDTYTMGTDFVGDTVGAFENAGSDLEDGDVLGAAGDVMIGGVDDLGDVATGAYDLAGDALEGGADLVEDTASAVENLPSDLEDVGESALVDAEDVADDIGEGAEDVGDGIEDVVDDIGDLF